MVNTTVMELLILKMATNILDNLRIIIKKDKEKKFTQMDHFLLEIL